MSGGIRLSHKFLKRFKVKHDQIDSLRCDLLTLSDCFERRPYYLFELFMSQLALLQQIDDDIDDACYEMVEFEQIQQFGHNDFDYYSEFEIV